MPKKTLTDALDGGNTSSLVSLRDPIAPTSSECSTDSSDAHMKACSAGSDGLLEPLPVTSAGISPDSFGGEVSGTSETSPDAVSALLRQFVTEGTPDEVFARYASLPQRAAQSDFGEFDRNVVVLDTETTGFSLNHDELTQIAAARLEKGEVVDWFITFVNPGKPIPDDVAHLTDIHDEDVADAPLPADALTQLVKFVGDAKIVAHNAEFDRNFTTKHPAGYPLLENTWLDSLDLARIALPRMKSHRLIDLVRAFGAPLSTHRADDDVAATCALFRILLAAVDAMPTSLVGEIARMATPAEWSTSVVFAHFARENARRAAQKANEMGPAPAVSGTVGADDAAALTASGIADATAVSNIAARSTVAVLGTATASAVTSSAASSTASTSLSDAPDFAYEPFSLRTMRRDRVRSIEQRAKRDAKDIAEDPLSSLAFPSAREIDQAFSESGLVGSLYEVYEPRGEQVAMARAVRAVFATSDNLMVEAGTGVGKSMAYLVPAALTAVANNITVGVATKTNTLLDQLIYHELPALAQALETQGKHLTFTALKGFSHYPCLRKINRIVAEGPKMREVTNGVYSQAPALAALLSYIEQTEYDDMDGLKIDYRLLPRRSITTTSHDCLRRKCPFYGTSCFVHGSRRRAESAHVVVTNHSLLFCDLAADGGLLPPIRFWVVDEAHGAENEARRAFSLELSVDDLNNLAQRVSAGETSRNVFVRAERNVVAPDSEGSGTLFYALTNKAKEAGRLFAEAEGEFAAHVRDLLYFDPPKRNKGYEYVDLWINDEIRRSSAFQALAGFGQVMSERAERLITACQELVGYLEDVEGAAVVQREIASVAMELKDVLRAAETILFAGSESYVYAAHLCHKAGRGGENLEALLYNVGARLGETLYSNTYSVVYASATLTVDESFASFEAALGLNADELSHCTMLKLDSSYDFDSHMTVYVVKDMPEPNEPRYLPELQRLLIGAHIAQRGSMLTLFTNRREMEKCFDEVQPVLKSEDLRLVCQKWGVSVKGLRDDFLADEHLSLFALKSFWEGFDAPGATLKGVIIPKLPFAKPTDPLSCERAARDAQAWRRYVLPAAVLETKQAAGRLIRKADDEGVLILADKRLVTKGYGKAFLKSLPSKNIHVCTIDEVISALGRA